MFYFSETTFPYFILSIIIQISDFSMAPNYIIMHDLNQERSHQPQQHSSFSPVRIVMDSMRPYHRCGLLILIVSILLIWIILDATIFPKQYIIKTNQSELHSTVDHSCMNPSGFENDTLMCADFAANNPYLGLILRDVSPLNQFALISLEIEGHQQNKEGHLELQQYIMVDLYQLQLFVVKDQGRFRKKTVVGSKTVFFDGREAHQSFMYSKLPLQHVIGLYRNLQANNYLLVIKFSQPKLFTTYNMKPFLKAYLSNPVYTLITTITREILFIVSLITFAIYFYFYFKMEPKSRLIEQKLVLMLSISLLIFNDPIYAYTIIKPNSINTVISVIFFMQMIAMLLLYLICSLRKIRYHETRNLSGLGDLIKWWEVGLFMGSYFAILGFLYSQLALKEFDSQILLYPFRISPKLVVLAICWLLAVVVYIIYLARKAFQKENALWRTNGWASILFFLVGVMVLYFLLLQLLWPQKSRLLSFMTLLALAINIIIICNQLLFTKLPQPTESHKFRQVGLQQLSGVESTDIQMQELP